MMASSEVFSQCVLIIGLPDTFRRNDVSRTLQRHLKEGQAIVDTDFELGTPGTPSKWVIQLNSREAAQKLYNEVIQEEVYLSADKCLRIKYEMAQPSQIPEKWKQQEMLYPKLPENVPGTHPMAMFPPNNNFPMYNSSGNGMFQNHGQAFHPNTNVPFGFRPPVGTSTQRPVPPIPDQTAQQYDNTNIRGQFPPPINQTYHDKLPTPSAPPNVQGNPQYRFPTPSSYQGEAIAGTQFSHQNQTKVEGQVLSSVPYQGQMNQFPPMAPIQVQAGQSNPLSPVASFEGHTGSYPVYQYPPTPLLPSQFNQNIHAGNQYGNMLGSGQGPGYPVYPSPAFQYPQIPVNVNQPPHWIATNYGQGNGPNQYPSHIPVQVPRQNLPLMHGGNQHAMFEQQMLNEGRRTIEGSTIQEYDSHEAIKDHQMQGEDWRHLQSSRDQETKHQGTKQSSEASFQETEEHSPESETEEDEQTCIRVDGVSEISSKENLEMYFENQRRSGGGDIERVWFDSIDDDVMFIQFKEASVAKAVLAHRHTFENRKLNVSGCAPITYYNDRVLIEDIKQTTTQECLSNFLEVKADCIAIDMCFSHNENAGKVLVTMDTNIDMKKMEAAFSKYKLEGATLKVSRVPVSNCLLVTSLTPDIHEDTIEFYFENSRKSGGGPVERVKLSADKSACLVYFENFRDIDNVIKKKHTLNNVPLTVEHFQPCFGLPKCFAKKKKMEMPSDITLENVNSHKISLLRTSERVHQDFQEKLSVYNASINIPSDIDGITISYKGENPSQDEFELVENWEQNVTAICTKFMDEIMVNETNIQSNKWEKAMQSLQSISIENSDTVIVKVDRNAKLITVIGYRNIVCPLIKKIEAINDEQSTIPDVNEKVSKETITVKPIECRMLDSVGFSRDVTERYSSLKVSFEDNYKGITFEGNAGDINAAKVEMYETKNRFGTSSVKIADSLCLQLYNSKQTKEYISKILKNRQLSCLFEVTGDTVDIYSEDKSNIEKCAAVIRRAVGYHSVHISREAKGYFGTRMCNQKLESLQEINEGKVLIELNTDEICVEVCALENMLEDIVDEIKKDFSKNASLQKKINCSINEATFIEKYKKANLTEIEHTLVKYRVKLESKQSGILVQGPVEGTSKAVEQVLRILRSIKKKDHTFKKTSFALAITSEKGRKQLNTIERDLSCLIATKESSDDKPANPNSPGSHLHATCRLHDKLEIQTMRCDITEVEVAMIVNSTDEEITMHHGLGKLLAIKGGREVKDACKDFIAKNGKLRECQVYVGPAGNLNADYILHLSVPKFRQGHEADNKLSTAIFNCLCQADEYKSDSIAIPAVGCGAARYPAGKATDIIVEAIEKFFSSKHRRSVTKIILCDMKADNVEEFTRALTDQFGRRKVQLIKQDEKGPERDPSGRKQGTKNKEHTRRRNASENVDKVSLGSITVSVVKGSVARQKCDAIVNIVDKALDLKRGTISATLLNNGGAELQQELQTKYPNGLEYGQIAVTSGNKLSCKFVIHARLGPWSGADKDSSKESLQTFLNLCLRGADQQKVSCVVFPAIGTGKLGYPKEIAAKEMFTAIAEFSKNNQQSTIKEIRIVIYQDDSPTLEAFENESSFWETGERHNPRDLRSVYLDAETDRHRGERKGSETNQIGTLGITVKLGNILDEYVDCMVISVLKSLDLEKGAVSKEMYKRCGDEVKTELEKKKDWLRKSDLVTTSAPNLKCKGLIHVATQDKTDGWQHVVEKALKKAEEKQWRSIAFPALGTSYRIKPECIAECMVAAFKCFEKTKPRYVCDIRLVIYQRDMLHIFHDAVFSVQSKFQGKDGGEHHRHRIKRSSDPDSITFTILASENSVIERAVSKIEECYDQKDFRDDIINTFSKYHKDDLKDLEGQEGVTISLDKDKGRIHICGLKDNVTKASEKVHSIMRNALKFEKNKTSAEMMSNLVQWCYTDAGSGQLVPYDKPINFKIENAYKADDTFVSYTDSKQEKFTIDLQQMIAYPVKKPQDSINVQRKDLMKAGSANIPSTWAPMTGNSSLVALANTDPEFIATKTTFLNSIGNATIVKIERVQNKMLWQQYQAKKQQMNLANPPNTKNESLLWHGSSSVGIDNILVHGFDRSYSNMGCSIGVGVYFSPMATVSHGFARADGNGVKRMFHCRVLTGEYTPGQSSIRYPPPKPSGGPYAKYDSVVNNVNAPTEFVIFNDTQAYPEYLISFQ